MSRSPLDSLFKVSGNLPNHHGGFAFFFFFATFVFFFSLFPWVSTGRAASTSKAPHGVSHPESFKRRVTKEARTALIPSIPDPRGMFLRYKPPAIRPAQTVVGACRKDQPQGLNHDLRNFGPSPGLHHMLHDSMMHDGWNLSFIYAELALGGYNRLWKDLVQGIVLVRVVQARCVVGRSEYLVFLWSG